MKLLQTFILRMVVVGRVMVWAACPTAINNMEMILQGTIKFQVGSTFDLASLISLGTWPVLKKKTT